MKYSIVIISKDNRKYLLNCVEKLFQYINKEEVEIIVVESGNNIENLPGDVRHIKIPLGEAGFSNQRNIGVKNANSENIIFIDDDVEVAKDWFKNLIKGVDENTLGCMGAVFPKNPNIIGFCEGVMGHPGGGFRLHNLYKNQTAISQIATCNTILKKDVIDKAGWFDLKNKYGSEDTDLCIRITKTFGKNKFKYVPDALVWHYPKNNFFDFIKWYIRRGKADADLFLKHTVHIGYLISTAITLKILIVVILSCLFGWIVLLIAFFVWYLLQLNRSKFMFKYFYLYNFSFIKKVITFFIYPSIKFIADIMFDIGRVIRICGLGAVV